MLTLEEVKKAVGKEYKGNISQQLIDTLNQLEEGEHEAVKENFITFANVLSTGRYSMEEYFNAVRFVSYRLMGVSSVEAYGRVFPDRLQRLVQKNVAEKQISAYASTYAKTKLVVAITSQAYVPAWILNQDAYQRAINTQVRLLSAKSEKVQCMAADSLLKHLAKPEEVAPLININTSSYNGLEDLKTSINELAKQQKKLIEQGRSTKEIIEQDIIDVEPV